MSAKFIFIIITALFIRCDTDELHDLNINPQSVNQVNLNFIFSAAQLGIASNGSSGSNRSTDVVYIAFCAHAIQHLACADCPNSTLK